jgi:hypothetical protein
MSYFGGKSFKKVYCGAYITFVHAVDNSVYAFGALVATSSSTTAIGSCDGTGAARTYPVSCIMTNVNPKVTASISASFSNAMLVTTDGSLFTTGAAANYLVIFHCNTNNIVGRWSNCNY